MLLRSLSWAHRPPRANLQLHLKVSPFPPLTALLEQKQKNKIKDVEIDLVQSLGGKRHESMGEEDKFFDSQGESFHEGLETGGKSFERDLQLDDEDSEGMDLDDVDIAQTNQQLFKIEKKIQSHNISKKERRLLQNRKSALKCRLKK